MISHRLPYTKPTLTTHPACAACARIEQITPATHRVTVLPAWIPHAEAYRDYCDDHTKQLQRFAFESGLFVEAKKL